VPQLRIRIKHILDGTRNPRVHSQMKKGTFLGGGHAWICPRSIIDILKVIRHGQHVAMRSYATMAVATCSALVQSEIHNNKIMALSCGHNS